MASIESIHTPGEVVLKYSAVLQGQVEILTVVCPGHSQSVPLDWSCLQPCPASPLVVLMCDEESGRMVVTETTCGSRLGTSLVHVQAVGQGRSFLCGWDFSSVLG